MKIAVLYGGVSKEREVSLSTGKGIIDALEKKGYDVFGIDFHPDRLDEMIQLKADIVFVGLHGKYGEDGKVQALLDMLDIPYVGSGVQASALAMDKARAKLFFKRNGTNIAAQEVLYKHRFDRKAFDTSLSFPIVVKPNEEGSTIGITFAHNEDELLNGIEQAFTFDNTVLLEEFVEGTEVTVAVLGNKGKEQALPVVEIVPKNKYYDYEAKYTAGGSEHIVPARLSEQQTKYVQTHALLAHEALGCDIYSRADFIVPHDGRDPIILEVNTLPGLTPTSLFPDAAKEIGLSYEDLVEKFVLLSLKKERK